MRANIKRRKRPIGSARTAAPVSSFCIGIAILAGGLSSRLGCDKSRLRLGRRTLLGHVRTLARETGLPARLIRRDLVPRCGPLGGVYTALKTSRAEAELFLACDMPLVTPALLRQLLREAGAPPKAAFVTQNGQAGFPFLLPVSALVRVDREIRRRSWSLQALARSLQARKLAMSPRRRAELLNINSWEDWRRAQSFFRRRTRARVENGGNARLS